MKSRRRFTGLIRFRQQPTGIARRKKAPYARGAGCGFLDGWPAVTVIGNVRLCAKHLARVERIKQEANA